jgi:serine/threonine protein kinase
MKTVGRYQLEQEIGRGMMGVVYRALDPHLERPVALKLIELGFAASAQEREAFEKRFLAEARAAASLSHPGILVVHDVGRDAASGTLFIAFEYLQGKTLAHLAGEGSRPDWREALRLTARVARALQHAHDRGIVHRDIKPANIMLLDTGVPKIMDFGIARLPASQLTATGEFFGTPAYMSPEQLSGAALDGRSDVFSLGAVLYRLLTGHDAFQGANVPETLARILHQEPAPPSRLAPGLPPGLDEVVARALAKKVEERYPDARSLAEDLEALQQGTVPVAPPQASSVSPEPRPSRRAWLVGGVALAALGALAVWGAWRVGGPALLPTPPARLEVRLDHSLKSGTLRVWVDEELLVEEPLTSRVTDDLVVMKLRKGRAEKTVEVAPGAHEIRVQVSGEGFNATRTIEGDFVSGATQKLAAEAGGIIKKELRLFWN